MEKRILAKFKDVDRISVKCYKCGIICHIHWYLNICPICAEKEFKIVEY